MHNLALALVQKGYRVSGSDDEIYEPSRTRLESAGILPAAYGWFPEKITADLDGIIFGEYIVHGMSLLSVFLLSILHESFGIYFP